MTGNGNSLTFSDSQRLMAKKYILTLHNDYNRRKMERLAVFKGKNINLLYLVVFSALPVLMPS